MFSPIPAYYNISKMANLLSSFKLYATPPNGKCPINPNKKDITIFVLDVQASRFVIDTVLTYGKICKNFLKLK